MTDSTHGQGNVRWHGVGDSMEMESAASRRILDAAERALAERGRFSIVLAGGNTPRGTYTLLRGARTDWSLWDIWFGDERCAPTDDPLRNSEMARVTLLDELPMIAANVRPIPAELGAEAATALYAEALRDVDDFDLVLLGLGEDGHTASLFPGRDAGGGAGSPDVLAIVDAPKPPPQRVSLSAARLSRAREVLFLVDGESKRDAVKRWRAGQDIPASRIVPPGGVDVLVQVDLLG
ncbi:MAG TPA: 6-phosphogluconolactonase [Xanthomonadaceae bacterium]|jgi:6-phosphogluconolactonase|nr:6-phosphogluconolactonase [Xanthomonadaceae bacterium]